MAAVAHIGELIGGVGEIVARADFDAIAEVRAPANTHRKIEAQSRRHLNITRSFTYCGGAFRVPVRSQALGSAF
jgi:hypothetical protein